MSNNSPQININNIRIEFIHGRKKDGSLWTISELATKYGIPKTTLYDISKKKDFNGLNWEQARQRELAILEGKIAKKIRDKQIAFAEKNINAIADLIDTNLELLKKASTGYDFKRQQPDPTKAKPIPPSGLLKLLELGTKLRVLLDNNVNSTQSIKLEKPIEEMSFKELAELEKKIRNSQENTIEGEYKVVE